MDDIYDVILDDIENLKEDLQRYKKDKYVYKSGTTCPNCGDIKCPTSDSRYINNFQRRRRTCNNCGARWNTIEVRI